MENDHPLGRPIEKLQGPPNQALVPPAAILFLHEQDGPGPIEPRFQAGGVEQQGSVALMS